MIEKHTNTSSNSKKVPNFRYMKDQNTNPKVSVGDFTYGNPSVRWLIQDDTVTIGKFTSFAGGVEILMSANHPIDSISAYPFSSLKDIWPGAVGVCPMSKGDVNIGNDVWVGLGVTIMSGVTIGDGAVIGAHALVARDIPPYAIAVGNPAQVIRKRFDEQTIAMLLDIKWWNWSEDKIRRNIEIISGKEIWKIKECQ